MAKNYAPKKFEPHVNIIKDQFVKRGYEKRPS